MLRKKKIVLGTYIEEDVKDAIEREANRQGLKPSTLASEILKKIGKQLIRKEKKDGENKQDEKTNHGL